MTYRQAAFDAFKEFKLAAESGDNEVAHLREDELRDLALLWIARHGVDPLSSDMAKFALQTGDEKYDFERWYA